MKGVTLYILILTGVYGYSQNQITKDYLVGDWLYDYENESDTSIHIRVQNESDTSGVDYRFLKNGKCIYWNPCSLTCGTLFEKSLHWRITRDGNIVLGRFWKRRLFTVVSFEENKMYLLY